MLAMLIIVLFVCLFLGFPMFMSMLLSSLIAVLVFLPSLSPTTIVQQLMGGISTFALLAIPLFIFAADIMSTGKTATKLIDLMKAFLGHIPGGLGVTMVGTCTLFGAISGSTQATVVAVGKTMRPDMLKAGYDDSDISGLIVSSSNIAMLIPPSVAMIMYCVVTGTSVGEMFIAGITPGIVITILFMLWQYFRAKRHNTPTLSKMNWSERGHMLAHSLLPLGFPIIIIGSIYSGIASPTEAAAISVLYALILEVCIYKTIKLKDIPQIALSTAEVTAALFILLAVGQIFSLVLTYAGVPQMLTENVLGAEPSQVKVLTCVTIFFFIACMFIDPLVAIVVLTPMFYTTAMNIGIDPIWLGIIVTMQNAVGAVSPPFGCNIFTACAAFNSPYTKVVKGIPPYFIILIFVSIFLIFFPQVITFYRFF